MRFSDYIEAKRHKPFVWGQNDCVMFVASWVQITTGRDYLRDVDIWTSEFGATRVLLRMGGLEKILDERLRRINPHFAEDGDIALHKGCLRLFNDKYIVSPGEKGLVYFGRMEAECAWHC